MPEWEADLAVDADVLRLIAGQPRTWRLLANGWDSDAWLADGNVVWRVARRRVAIPALEREAAVLARLAGRLPVRVPEVTRVEAAGGLVLLRHELVPGDELATRPVAAPALGASLGWFLRVLHERGRELVGEGVVPADPLGRADAAKRIAFANRRLDDVATRLDTRPLRAVVAAAQGLAPPVDVLCHGDLHIRHVIVLPTGELSGVIDWGDCCVGARAMDLAVVTALEPPVQAAFLAEYGPVPEADWRFARMLGVMFGASLLAAEPDSTSGRGARRWLERLAADTT